jgi:WD40 repeat protein
MSTKHVRNALKACDPSVYIHCIDFSPDGRLIALGTSTTKTGGALEIRNWRDDSQNFFKKSKWSLHCICFNPDGQYIAGGFEGGDVVLWNVRTGKCVKNLQGHYDEVTSVAFMPDGTGLVSSSKDLSVRGWDLSPGSEAPESSTIMKGLNAMAHKVCHFYSILAYALPFSSLFFLAQGFLCWNLVQ